MQELTVGVCGGLGHIGLIQAAGLAKLGYKITAYDTNITKTREISQGKMPFQEPGLEELVMDSLNRGLLKFTARVEDLQEADIVFVCVGTPSLPSGESDLDQVYTAVEQIATHRNKPCLAVIKSTVPVGTSRKLTEFLRKIGLAEKVSLVSNPEFLREGSGVLDFWEPSRIVVGSENAVTSKKVASLYSPPGASVILTTWENAELIKLASNAFLSTKISFINEIALLSEKVGADIRVISNGLGLDPRINPHFIEAGVGFSGPCLEKDLRSLIDQFQKVQQKARILESVLQVNEGQRQGIVQKLQQRLGTLEGKRIAVFGMAFKTQTDDVRQSHSLPIVKHLLSLGAVLTVSDPWVSNPEQAGIDKAELPGIEWVSSPFEAARGKDAVLILTAWPEYKDLDLNRLHACMKNPLVVDGRNLYKAEDMQARGIDYVGVGL